MSGKTERVAAALAGEIADRAPWTGWHHFPGVPATGDAFVQATLDFYRRYDPDILKVMHDAPYELPHNKTVFDSAADWAMLVPNPPDSGTLGEHLRALRHLLAYKNDDAPVIDTVYSVFSTAQKIAGGRILEHLDENRALVTTGLQRLAAAITSYAKAVVADAGCAGIFLAVGGIDADWVPTEVYEQTFRPLDRLILSGAHASGATCNIVHLHGDNLPLDTLLPLADQAHALSWSDRAAGPSLADLRARTNKCVVGGVNERTINGVGPEQVKSEVADALAQTGGGRGLIVAPGCTLPPDVPPANVDAIRNALQG